MRVVAVWRERTDYAREVQDWMKQFEQERGIKVESVNPDSKEGELFVEARDLLQYPTVLVLTDAGMVVAEFKGRPLPQFAEVGYYLGNS